MDKETSELIEKIATIRTGTHYGKAEQWPMKRRRRCCR